MPRPDVGRQQLAAVFEHDGAQHGALRERQALPRFFEDRVLFAEQARRACGADRRVPRSSASRRLDVVPRLVRETLHVVGHVAAELDDRGAQAGLGAHAARGEARLEKRREQRSGDLFQPHDRSGLVERPAWRPSIRSISDGSEPAKT